MPKIRKVMVTMEVETDASVAELRDPDNYTYYGNGEFFITEKPKVTVVQPIKKGGKK